MSVLVPSPSCPDTLLPQHHKVPSDLRAHVNCAPVAISATSEPSAITCTGDGAVVVVPSPTAPALLPPQHQSVPSVLRAHVCPGPADTSATLAPSAVTWTGDTLFTVVPSPSCPAPLLPQHQRVPSVLRAHVWLSPA